MNHYYIIVIIVWHPKTPVSM